MADTITRTFNLLNETDRKLDQLASETFLRSKGNVIDWAVDKLWQELHPESMLASDGVPPESKPAADTGENADTAEAPVKRMVAAQGLDGQLRIDPGFH